MISAKISRLASSNFPSFHCFQQKLSEFLYNLIKVYPTFLDSNYSGGQPSPLPPPLCFVRLRVQLVCSKCFNTTKWIISFTEDSKSSPWCHSNSWYVRTKIMHVIFLTHISLTQPEMKARRVHHIL